MTRQKEECVPEVVHSMKVTRKATVVGNVRAEWEGPTKVRVLAISGYTQLDTRRTFLKCCVKTDLPQTTSMFSGMSKKGMSLGERALG